jgi:hypothetical protein
MKELIQGSDAWLQARRGKITASQFKVLMSSAYGLTEAQSKKFSVLVDKDKRTDAQEKELAKLGLSLSDPFKEGAKTYAKQIAGDSIQDHFEEGFESFAMARGTELEPVAVEEYERITFQEVDSVGFVQMVGNDFVGGSPDGLIGDFGGVEVKCPAPAKHIENLLATECPADYIDQVQGLLLITGRKWWDFVSYNPNFKEGCRLKIIRVFPDEMWQFDFMLRINGFEELVKEYKDRLNSIPN